MSKTASATVADSASGNQVDGDEQRTNTANERFGGFALPENHVLPIVGRRTNNGRRPLAERPIVRRALRDRNRPGWFVRYQRGLILVDLLAASIGSFLAYWVRFGEVQPTGMVRELTFAGALPIAWVFAAAGCGAYEARFVGVGTAEYERVLRAFAYMAAACMSIFYLLDAPVARGFVFPALGTSVVLAVVGRRAARIVLRRRRHRGQALSAVIAVGGAEQLVDFVTMVHTDRDAGLRVVGACVPEGCHDARAQSELAGLGVPILGDIDSLRDAVARAEVHTVAVLAGNVGSDRLRWIAWQLEGTSTDLVVSPGLADFGGQRLHVQPVAGLPLLHIDQPAYTGFRRILKSAFDRLVAGVSLLLLSPVLVLLGLWVRFDSRGPALFRQARVGRDGRTFTMVKFRSMVDDAETRLHEVQTQNENDGLKFKMRKDPRVTRAGRTLRRLSLDELPQLINVLTGSMSLVGPRPPLPSEVALYGDDVRRRLLVKPGLTGLWQVSGRSDLSWEESVRLDLRYVEDWSLSLDMIVLWRTLRAVLRSDGAY